MELPADDVERQNDNLVEVATFVYPQEAKIARAELEAESIPCYLANERTLDVDWFLANVLGGYRLLVPGRYVEEARAILDARVSDAELTAQAEAAKPPDDGGGGQACQQRRAAGAAA